MSHDTVRIAANVAAAVDADGAILLDAERGTYYSLNDVGAEIWALIEEGLPPSTIAQRLSQSYDVSVGTALADVEQFLAGLASRGLILGCT